MKKMLCWACLLMALALLPALAMAEETVAMPEVAAPIDWTALMVAVIGVIGTALSALLGRVWVKYVKPWLEQRDLTDAAKIVVEAVEALLGRYCGEGQVETGAAKDGRPGLLHRQPAGNRRAQGRVEAAGHGHDRRGGKGRVWDWGAGKAA